MHHAGSLAAHWQQKRLDCFQNAVQAIRHSQLNPESRSPVPALLQSTVFNLLEFASYMLALPYKDLEGLAIRDVEAGQQGCRLRRRKSQHRICKACTVVNRPAPAAVGRSETPYCRDRWSGQRFEFSAGQVPHTESHSCCHCGSLLQETGICRRTSTLPTARTSTCQT